METMMLSRLALFMVFAVTPLLALIQAVPALDNSVSQLERTGLIGVLLIGVGYLARARDTDRTKTDTMIAALVASKDAALAASAEAARQAAEHMTAAMVTQAASNQELRNIIEKGDATNASLRDSIERLGGSLGRLPCKMEDDERRSLR